MVGRAGKFPPGTKSTAMLKTAAVVPAEEHFFLSTLSPGPAQKRIALVVVLGLIVVSALITAGLFSGIQTSRVEAFLPAYLTAMFVCDSITAILLFAQYSILRARSILVLASAYLFTALILIPYLLTFPGVFTDAGLLGGLQSSAWVYVLWHCGFPVFVIGYAFSKDRAPSEPEWNNSTRAEIAESITLTAVLVFVAGFLCIAGEASLPRIMLDNSRFGPQWPYLVGAPIALVTVYAIIVVWLRRRSMLDLWLLVVVFLYLIEVPLSYYPAPSRFSGGWYAVRIFGFLASSLVLIVLLYEIQALYARLLRAVLAQRREREARLMTGDAVAATIAHEVKQPLTAMTTSATAGFRYLDRLAPNLPKAKEAFKQIVADGHRAAEVVDSIRVVFKSDARTRAVLDVADTGAGIGTQDSERLFDPLFTTKSDGMGMGLSICRAIVEAHDGRLWVTPNTPRGAVFQFTLRSNASARL